LKFVDFFEFFFKFFEFKKLFNNSRLEDEISKLTFNTAADIMNELLIHFALEQSHLDLKVVLQIHGL